MVRGRFQVWQRRRTECESISAAKRQPTQTRRAVGCSDAGFFRSPAAEAVRVWSPARPFADGQELPRCQQCDDNLLCLKNASVSSIPREARPFAAGRSGRNRGLSKFSLELTMRTVRRCGQCPTCGADAASRLSDAHSILSGSRDLSDGSRCYPVQWRYGKRGTGCRDCTDTYWYARF